MTVSVKIVFRETFCDVPSLKYDTQSIMAAALILEAFRPFASDFYITINGNTLKNEQFWHHVANLPTNVLDYIKEVKQIKNEQRTTKA